MLRARVRSYVQCSLCGTVNQCSLSNLINRMYNVGFTSKLKAVK